MPPHSPSPACSPDPSSSLHSHRFVLCLVATWAVIMSALVAASVWGSDGHLIYSLDDPYIHLSVAETILSGGYGVNQGDYAAPSSSILYPLLLVVTTVLGLGEAGPLVVNVLAMLLAVLVVGRLLTGHVLTDELLEGAPSPLRTRLAVGLACCVVMNAWGLVMTGMEHSLHVLLSVTVLWRLALGDDLRRRGGGGFDPLLVAASVALPLVRFEGIALTLAVTVALLFLRRLREAVVTLSLTAVALGAWVLFTLRLGLPWLPSSVLMKSEFAARMLENNGVTALAQSIAQNVRKSLLDRQGVILIGGTVIATLYAARAFACGRLDSPGRLGLAGQAALRWRADFVCGAVAVGTALAHVVLGHYGWFTRYEVYAVQFVVFACLVLARAGLARTDARVAVTCALLVVGAPYILTTAQTPWAARGIYDQQFQMHRFVVERWRRPIAANDLGWLSYQNPHYVLDLWGLGSEHARQMARRGSLNAGGIGELVRERGIDLAILYESYFFDTAPEGWVRVAVLRSQVVTGGQSEVSFFATSATPVVELRALLQEFAPTLPWRVKLELQPVAAE